MKWNPISIIFVCNINSNFNTRRRCTWCLKKCSMVKRLLRVGLKVELYRLQNLDNFQRYRYLAFYLMNFDWTTQQFFHTLQFCRKEMLIVQVADQFFYNILWSRASIYTCWTRIARSRYMILTHLSALLWTPICEALYTWRTLHICRTFRLHNCRTVYTCGTWSTSLRNLILTQRSALLWTPIYQALYTWCLIFDGLRSCNLWCKM